MTLPKTVSETAFGIIGWSILSIGIGVAYIMYAYSQIPYKEELELNQIVKNRRIDPAYVFGPMKNESELHARNAKFGIGTDGKKLR